MGKRRHEEEEHENEERWLLTYSDLITLLMAFFMVMFALSQVDAKKFKSLAISLSDAFNGPGRSVLQGVSSGNKLALIPKTSTPKQFPDPGQTGPSTTPPRYEDIKDLQKEFDQLVKSSGLQGSVSVSTNEKGDKLTVRLSDSLLFEAGSSDLGEKSREVMDEVAELLAKAGRPIRIEGHTDNVPTRNGTNWQLSTNRAVNVLIYLTNRFGFDPQKLSAGGYGEWRPLASNDTPEGRAKNRRVEFVILDGEE